MKLKKFLSMMLSVIMLLTAVVQPVLAIDGNKQSDAVVEAVGYQSVANKIAVAEEITMVPTEKGNMYYYWGNNSFVVKDNNGYYAVEINEDFTQFVVNGKTFSIAINENKPSVLAGTYATDWVTMYDTNNTFDVGGMPHSVVGGLIGSAIGSFIPSVGLSTIIGGVLGTLAGTFLGGVFPVDYKITVMLYKRFRYIQMAQPTVIEYYERVAVYGGPANNINTTLYYNTDTYTQEYWD